MSNDFIQPYGTPTVWLLDGRSVPEISPLNAGAIYFDAATNKFKMSENGGAFVDLGGGPDSGWMAAAGTVELTTTTDGVGIGASPTGSQRFSVLGDATRKDLSIIGGAGAAGVVGGSVTITSGAGGTFGSGGSMTIAAGSSGSGNGGFSFLRGGAGGTFGTGGGAFVNGGNGGSTSGPAGDAALSGGTPFDGNGGNVALSGASGATTTATSRNGGAISGTAGNATVAGFGGAVNFVAGRGGTTGTAGTVLLRGGAGGTTSGQGGSVTLEGGLPTDGVGGFVIITGRNAATTTATSRSGGGVTITAGAGAGPAGAGGSITLTSGASTGSGASGTVIITGGSGSGTGAVAAGAATLRGGAAVTQGEGGSVFVQAGASAGTDADGAGVTISAADSTGTGNPGDVALDSHAFIRLNGIVKFGSATVASANDLLIPTGSTVGNYVATTGTTQINAIRIDNFAFTSNEGYYLILKFVSALTVKHNTAGGAGYSSLRLAGSVDFLATAGSTLTLIYDSGDNVWYETSRMAA